MSQTNNKKRLLVLTTSFPNTENPSAGTFVSSFSQAASKKYDVTILAPSARGSELIPPSGVSRLFSFRYAPGVLEVLAQFGGGIPSALKANRWLHLLVPFFLLGYFIRAFSLVARSDQVQANWIVSGLVAVIPCWLMRKPLVVTLHGEDARKVSARGVDYLLLRFFMVFGVRLVVVGQQMRDSLCSAFPVETDKIHWIPNGVSDCLWDAEAVRRDYSKPLRMIVVGSLIPLKSIDHALRLMSILKSKGVEVVLRIVGDGPERSNLDRMVADGGLGDSVVFTGAVTQNDLFRMYGENDLLLTCSRAEGRSSVVVEAMASGLLVVGADVDGVRELLGPINTAFSFPYGDIDALAGVIESLNMETAFNRLKDTSREYAVSVFPSWAATVDSYECLFNEMSL